MYTIFFIFFDALQWGKIIKLKKTGGEKLPLYRLDYKKGKCIAA
jgi:hypothetical protein